MHTAQKLARVDSEVDRVPRHYSPKGQRSGSARVRTMAGKTSGRWQVPRDTLATTRRCDAVAA